MLLPSRLGRYVFGELISPFFLGLALYTFVLMMDLLFTVAGQALAKNLPMDLVLQLFLSGVPMILVLAIPMSVLLGTLIAVGRLSADHEWVALQGTGQGPWRLLRPAAAFGLLATLAAFVVYSEWAPRANHAGRSLRGQVLVSSNLASDLKPRVFYTTIPDLVFFVENIRQADEKRLQGVLLVQRERMRGGRTTIHLAQFGDLYPAKDATGQLVADLYNGTSHQYTPGRQDSYAYGGFDSLSLRLEVVQFLDSILNPPRGPQDKSFLGLMEDLRTSAEEIETRRAEVAAADGRDRGARLLMAERARTNIVLETHRRLALPLACLLFALLAVPLGVTRVRSGKGAGFAVSLGVILLYWIAYTVGSNHALAGNIPAWLGPWVGNLIVAPWAAVAIYRMRLRGSDRRGPFAFLVWAVRRLLRGLRVALSSRRIRREARELEGTDEDPLESLSGTPNRFIGRFDRYVSVTYLRILGLALLSTYVISAMIEGRGLSDDIQRNDQPPVLLLEYLQYFAPGMLNQLLPISCLVGAVVTFTLLSRTGELTAVKAGGISMRRATVPVLLCTVGLCGVLFLVDDRIAPATNIQAREIKNRITGRSPLTFGINGTWGFGPEGNRLYHWDRQESDTGLYREFTVFRMDRTRPRILEQTFAPVARWNAPAPGESGEGRWEFPEGGWRRSFDDAALSSSFTALEQGAAGPRGLAPPRELAGSQFALTRADELSEQLSLQDLRGEIDELHRRGYDTTRLWFQYHAKWSQAFAPLVMVLLGLPFAFKVGRRGSLYGVGVSLLLVLIYWATFAVFRALGLETLLDPVLAAWGPNVLFALIGTYLMLYVKT